jgi:tetratricopeptide (TPR) repeat protein
MTPQQQLESGLSLQRAGSLAEAEKVYRQILSHQPDHAEVLNLLGILECQRNRLPTAVELFRRAIASCPTNAIYHNNLGNALRNNWQLDEAIASFGQSIRLTPDYAAAYSNLGNALMDAGRLDEAIASVRQAIRLKPDYAEAYFNLGNALRGNGQFEEAIEAYRQAIRIKPDYAEAHNNLGTAMNENGRLQEAVDSFQQAIKINPEYANAHFNCSMSLLALGDFKRGWREHAWRTRALPGFLFPMEKLTQPLWDGGELNGRVIFINAEQGFGDVIQFVRYVPMVAGRGGRVILGCQRELLRLLEGFPGIERMVTNFDPLPSFELHCPLLNLPLVFSTDLDSIPAKVPYLTPDRGRVEHWKSRIGSGPRGLKVGLVWAGRPKHRRDKQRSIPLTHFEPLTKLEGIDFFSLQKGEAARQPAPAGLKLIDYTDDLHDFADTAGLIANLDLVIAVDTAVAHLAGAMGKPVWALLPFFPDWRWLMDREDSPWYPTMRLFRQKTAGDWSGVIQNVAQALVQREMG